MELIWFTKFLSVIKHTPLWLLVAVSIASNVFWWLFPASTVSQNLQAWIGFAALLFPLFVICRFFAKRYPKPKSVRTFHLTPIENQSLIGVFKQQDGTMSTHVTAKFLVKNLTDKPLYLVKGKLVSPKISGKVRHQLVLIENPSTREYGSAYASKHCIPANATLPIMVEIFIQGKKKKKRSRLSAILAIFDDAGNEQQVKLELLSN